MYAKLGATVAIALAGVLAACPAAALELDFGAAVQLLPPGTIVHMVVLDNGASMTVTTENDGSGPDLAIVFDSADPTGGDVDLGTPNEDFGGPGKGNGGEEGEDGENADALGHLFVIADNEIDDDGDGLVDVPEDEADGGMMRFDFSHEGYLSLTIIDVDEDEDEPVLRLYRSGALVGTVTGESLGNNSAQHLDLTAYGEVDAVEIDMDGSHGIAEVVVNAINVGTEDTTWSGVKGEYR
ncbi:MAG: hypothetical protein ACE5G2_00190 [Candidatus Krumholzibacteriia bacterium]